MLPVIGAPCDRPPNHQYPGATPSPSFDPDLVYRKTQLPRWFGEDNRVMSLKPTYVGAGVVAAATVASIAAAPLAAADGADNAIADLQAQGYTVQINWVHGFDTEPLSVCTVTGINNP